MEEFHQKTGASKLLTVIFIILGILVGAGGVWYYMDKKASDDKATLQTQIDDLNKQVSDLKSDSTTSTAKNTTDSTADSYAGWKTYSSSTYGFSLRYPSTWTLTENGGSNADQSVVSIASPETTAAFEAADGQEGAYADDLSVYYYVSVSDEVENKTNNFGATTIPQLITTNNAITKIGTVTLGGAPATDVIWGGLSAYYTILSGHNNHLYKLFFSNISEKGQLTNIESQIISSFQYIN